MCQSLSFVPEPFVLEAFLLYRMPFSASRKIWVIHIHCEKGKNTDEPQKYCPLYRSPDDCQHLTYILLDVLFRFVPVCLCACWVERESHHATCLKTACVPPPAFLGGNKMTQGTGKRIGLSECPGIWPSSHLIRITYPGQDSESWSQARTQALYISRTCPLACPSSLLTLSSAGESPFPPALLSSLCDRDPWCFLFAALCEVFRDIWMVSGAQNHSITILESLGPKVTNKQIWKLMGLHFWERLLLCCFPARHHLPTYYTSPCISVN